MAESQALKGMPKEEKLDFILGVAADCFEEVGYNKITLDSIAERAGLSKGTLTYYFGNKEGLIAGLIRRHVRRLIGHLKSDISNVKGPEEKLRAGIESLWNAFFYDQDRLKAYCDLSAQAFFNSNLKSEIVLAEREVRNFFAEMLDDPDREDGAPGKGTAQFNAALILGAVEGLVRQVALDSEGFDEEQIKKGSQEAFRMFCDVFECRSTPRVDPQ